MWKDHSGGDKSDVGYSTVQKREVLGTPVEEDVWPDSRASMCISELIWSVSEKPGLGRWPVFCLQQWVRGWAGHREWEPGLGEGKHVRWPCAA